MGASKFAVPLLAPLGCLPIVRQEYKTGNDCYEPLNDLAKQHNEKIGPILNEYAKKPNGGFQFTVLDFYNAVIRRTTRSYNYRKSTPLIVIVAYIVNTFEKISGILLLLKEKIRDTKLCVNFFFC